MDRKEFLASSVTGAVACCAFAIFNDTTPAAAAEQTDEDREKDFVKNWMEDLFDTMYQELDEKTRVKLMAGCGRGCFRRFQFKQDIARLGKGDVDRLLEAYKRNFEVWREGNLVHVRYGATNKTCYCPAARYHPVKPHGHALRVHARDSPDRVRNGSGAADYSENRGIAAPRRDNVPLRGRHRVTGRESVSTLSPDPSSERM